MSYRKVGHNSMRKFDNQVVTLANGIEITVGIHETKDRLAFKIRFPGSGWSVTQLWADVGKGKPNPTILQMELEK